MSYKKINKNQGFTIIEVLIVLAIAGLILLVVFLAIPALQRSARNHQRKTDATAALSAVTQFLDNNNGTWPSGLSSTSNTLTFGAVNTAEATTQAKMGYYTKSFTYATTGGNANQEVYLQTSNASFTGGNAADFIQIDEASSCDGAAVTAQGGANPKIVPTVGASTQFVAVFEIEAGSGTYDTQCIQS